MIGDWSKNFIKSSKIDRAPRNTFTDQIFKNGDKKERSSPGVGKYDVDKQWK